MRKLIHSKFVLDLSNFKISDTEENNWFSDIFFTKYSFPFEIDLIDDLDIAFGFISLYNSSSKETYFELKYVHGDKIEDAVFEIEQFQTKLSCVLRFGFEQLPSFDKKLSELSLQKLRLPDGTDVYQHAQTVITQKWPVVNYNFPQVHLDKIDASGEMWSYFEGQINCRKEGVFLINDMDAHNSIFRNRNIMQPLPYLFHVLERGMADANLILAGEILNNEDLKKVTLYADVEYYKKYIDECLDIENQFFGEEIIGAYPFDGIPDPDFVFGYPLNGYFNYDRYSITKFTVKNAGTYKLAVFITFPGVDRRASSAFYIVKYRGRILKYMPLNDIGNWGNLPEICRDSFNISTENDINIHEFTIEICLKAIGGGNLWGPWVGFTAGFEITPVYLYEDNVNVVSTIINTNKIDLTRAVADITFGDLIRCIKNWYNYDLTIQGNLAVMNKVESQMNYNEAISFQSFEIKNPIQKFKKGNSFLLKFQDIESKDYTFLPVFQDRQGVISTGYKTDEKTNTIEINGLPLPLVTKNEIHTAHAFESGNEKIYFVIYDGLINNNNTSKPNNNYLLPVVYTNYWKKWINFRIKSTETIWSFKTFGENISNLKVKSKIFCYNKYHIIKTINKTEIKPDLFEIEINLESLD
ncbi:hypothetical protein [Flavobacterium psychrophilum]|uniref:hypothetical protein n=1 Tax=Flavobacterium psychrophilum TaxID=96345 RepID=UPI00141B2670|nr:hypothetical protein [Flavobacterium psychrophilum]MCB5980885.1 hypothetical protein [Flavobacterium psychrophilum]MCB6011695.1 hypothetical protein [Flavobacterium psychrophilum]MCB6016701.1 hypothetical protein [Flavobacterium psychrophilum]MCB6024446.1 hypothetical protein [Flavobacterium psychrophilum]MCB6029098.1 hypothetical protein [Flavobacterium psychrophilum]